MVRALFLGLGLMLLFTTQGCQTLQRITPAAPSDSDAEPPAAVVLPFPEPEPVARELDEDLIYSYLVGEIGANRGALQLAQSHYQHAAILAHDAYAAERATRIALHLKDYTAGLAAARRWVELSPRLWPWTGCCQVPRTRRRRFGRRAVGCSGQDR